MTKKQKDKAKWRARKDSAKAEAAIKTVHPVIIRRYLELRGRL